MDPVTIGNVIHYKSNGDTVNWKGVPGKNGTCVVSYQDDIGVIFNWSGEKNTSGPNINYSEDLRKILNKS